MAKMIQIPYDYNISVPIVTAQAVQQNNENPIWGTANMSDILYAKQI